jgi:hypothetical protein
VTLRPVPDIAPLSAEQARWLEGVQELVDTLDEIRTELTDALACEDVGGTLAAALRLLSLGVVVRERYYDSQVPNMNEGA